MRTGLVFRALVAAKDGFANSFGLFSALMASKNAFAKAGGKIPLEMAAKNGFANFVEAGRASGGIQTRFCEKPGCSEFAKPFFAAT